MRSGPAFGEPRSLAEQLQRAVDENQCEAIVTHTLGIEIGMRCESVNTTLHPALGKRLCFIHRCAAENFNRSTALRFVEKAVGK